MTKIITIFAIVGFLLFPTSSYATHETLVGGSVTVDSNDPQLSGPDDGCTSLHYHGILKDYPDPNPDGCGHGPAWALKHDEDDEASETPEKPSRWRRWYENAVDFVAGVVGAPPPYEVKRIVETVEDSAPGIQEKIENIDEYRENVSEEEDTLDIYRDPSEGLEEGSWSQKFFKWFNGLMD